MISRIPEGGRFVLSEAVGGRILSWPDIELVFNEIPPAEHGETRLFLDRKRVTSLVKVPLGSYAPGPGLTLESPLRMSLPKLDRRAITCRAGPIS